jgi:Rieske Fe-S protein
MRAAVELGVQIYEKSAAQEFSDSPRSVRANGRRISCDHIVIATHNPLTGNDSSTGATLFQTKLALYTSYVVAGRVKPGRVPDALFWDTADPYHYLRVAPGEGHDVVMLGGSDHKTGQVDDTVSCYERLEERLRSLAPGVELTHRWSGQVIETPDGLPYIGEAAPGQFVATGYSGNGMTFGTLAAMMARDVALGLKNPWQELFDVGRTKIKGGAWDYLKENKDYPYYLIRDRFAGAEGKSLRAVHRGEGKILSLHGQRVAASRSDDGTIEMLSPICTHMGCVVAWNTAERTWDCPCHGSRFHPDGRVLSGPAESPLEPVGRDGKVKARPKETVEP